MKTTTQFKLRYLVGAIALLGLTACTESSSPDDSTLIIGTGADLTTRTLEGTTTSNKVFASNTIEARSSSGERSVGDVSNLGRFQLDLTGTGPWLVRSDLGNNTYLYGIASDTSEDTLIQNVHSYSDAVVRNWFATQNLDIDSVFAASGAITSLPSTSELNAIYNTLTAMVADVIDNYDLTGTNLNTTEFAANGMGIDSFIKENPVIRNDDTITISIFDPENDTASVATEDLSLDTDLTSVDTIAPSAPTDLRALPSASDEITLVWTVASDDIGIARYAILRDGVEVATTPYPVYVDGGLASGSQFAYSVQAIDAEGNVSSASTTASAEPLAMVDTTAPPTPASVLIDTRRGSLDLTWTQTGISDVASYSIRRGNEPTSLPFFVSVNSTFFFDDAVNAGTQYCYEISAADASGNESVKTGVVCATAPGATVTGGTSTPTTPTGPTTPAGNLTAPQLDVTGVACVNELETSSITTATTISAGCYLAPRGLRVREPANVTLEPGVIIKFGSREDLRVDSGASLTAEGTAANPIVLTGLEASPGFWDGINFSSSNSVNNKLDHVQIEYAGQTTNNNAAVRINGNTSSPARAAISNSTIRFNAGPGLSISNGSDLSTFDGNRLTGNASPVEVHGKYVNLLDKRTAYTGNSIDAVQIESSSLPADTTWSNLGVPYHASSIDVDAVLTVEAGTTILFRDETDMEISDDGTIKMMGTAAAPITLSGVTALKGGWKGLDVRYSDNSNELNHVNIQYAGAGNREDAAIGIISNSTSQSRLSLNNVTITDSVGYGIGAALYTIFTEFDNVTITGNDKLANVGIVAAQAFNNAGSYTGNTVDAIEVKSALVRNNPVTLSNTDVPYFMNDIDVDDDILTLEAGVNLQMASSAEFEISEDGAIIANGTAASPVSIVGRQSIAGYWNGLEFRYANSPINRLSHTLLAHGGDGGGGIDRAANARFICTSSSPSRLTIDNSRIEDSAGFGLHLSSDDCLVTLDDLTTFSNNASGATN